LEKKSVCGKHRFKRMNPFKDLFSTQSTDYARFRPNYPDSLFRYLASLVEEKSLAWDCGTGNGQAAIKLANYFDQVIATDPSEKQLQNATQHLKIKYLVATAENPGIADNSVNLVTVAQALHWFKREDFYRQVKRVAKEGGILAVWCYGLARISPGIDRLIYELYESILGPYWEKERTLVDKRYQDIEFPFNELTPPEIEMTADWTLEHLLGYISTWSAVKAYIKQNNKNPLEALSLKLQNEWNPKEAQKVRWTLALRVGRV
jgi:SAM-dependent methyltransferase